MERRVAAGVCVALAAVGLVVGWWALWFLTDDAFIAFRYVSNSRLGHGYVWNPPPWRPVEGYTSWLWIAILDATWSLTGVEPPRSANVLSLFASLGSLAVVAWMAWRLPLSERLEPARVPLLGLVLAGWVGNRTTLAFTSSGLETALDTLLVLGWVAIATLGRGQPAWALATLAALLELCRPDGLLYVAATVAVLAILRRPLAALPLACTIAHLLWRRATYGYWLPNTWYAKHVAPWPMAGAAYAASFVLEYAFWIWLALAAAVAVRARHRPQAVPAVAVLALLGHAAYYTLLVGGDHFEFRVYHHLVPLILVSFPWLCDRLGWTAPRTIGLFATMLALGAWLPWTHYVVHAGRTERPTDLDLAPIVAVPGLRQYAAAWDGLQGWLHPRYVCTRHHALAMSTAWFLSNAPDREDGLRVGPESLSVLAATAVGVHGWTLPHVAIIDRLGLNDLVIARTPVAAAGQRDRLMAHDRWPPVGYVQCFRPNVRHVEGRLVVEPRDVPLTEAEVRGCEERFLQQVMDGTVEVPEHNLMQRRRRAAPQ